MVNLRNSTSRFRVLDAIRSISPPSNKETSIGKTSTLRCFPLSQKHVTQTPLRSPSDFHSTLCSKIRSAQKRVYLASLYIGPAADPIYKKEHDLLDSLQYAASKDLDIKILMDVNRGLRPVPLKNGTGERLTITSAEACSRAIRSNVESANGKVHLLSVLPSWLQRRLKNPYNEAAGVFHLKAYIIDDELILSGANLSEEYFEDRFDRYLWIQSGGNGLVNLYADIVNALCDHSEAYGEDGQQVTSRQQLLDRLTEILTTDEEESMQSCNPDESLIVAYAVPTFQAPPSYFYGMKPSFASDMDTIKALIEKSAEEGPSLSLRLASAYLNPPNDLIDAFQRPDKVYLLTAGLVSHGFKPKEKAGNKGKAWIPDIFTTVAQEALQKLPTNTTIWYYQRPEWTFHAKGLWLASIATESDQESDSAFGGLSLPTKTTDVDLFAVTHGSGNYGGRSRYHDMESNLIMILPNGSPLSNEFIEEWNQMCKYAVPSDQEERRELSWTLRTLLPFIKSFF